MPSKNSGINKITGKQKKTRKGRKREERYRAKEARRKKKETEKKGKKRHSSLFPDSPTAGRATSVRVKVVIVFRQVTTS
jgi:hypothetical protein